MMHTLQPAYNNIYTFKIKLALVLLLLLHTSALRFAIYDHDATAEQLAFPHSQPCSSAVRISYMGDDMPTTESRFAVTF